MYYHFEEGLEAQEQYNFVYFQTNFIPRAPATTLYRWPIERFCGQGTRDLW